MSATATRLWSRETCRAGCSSQALIRSTCSSPRSTTPRTKSPAAKSICAWAQPAAPIGPSWPARAARCTPEALFTAPRVRVEQSSGSSTISGNSEATCRPATVLPAPTASLRSTRRSPYGNDWLRGGDDWPHDGSPQLKNGRLAIAIVMTWVALAVTGCASGQLQPATPQPASEAAPASAALNQTPAAAAQSTPAIALTRAQIESQLLNLVNQHREQSGLKPLTIAAELERSAEAHSAAMVQGRFMSVRG